MSPRHGQPLDEYARKRHFEDTPEPAGTSPADEAGVPSAGATARFVVHEHHARRLHWDLRLERDGVLVSWAVPNGIPEDPRHNRKAVHVEDHPLSYIDFAGTIPAGNYGAGEVSVWDQGTYQEEKWELGKVVVVFRGGRLSGRYALFRAGREEKDWMIHRMDPPADPEAEEMPKFIAPVIARRGRLPEDASGWAFEIAWRGTRVQVCSQPGRLALLGAEGEDITRRFSELRGINRALSSHSAILDGVVVGEGVAARLMLFDLLWLDGHPLVDLPYAGRRERLDALGLGGERWSVPAYHRGDGTQVLEAAGKLGLSQIVAKRLDSPYRPGARARRSVRAGRG